jgi:GTP cyclohydrolase IA
MNRTMKQKAALKMIPRATKIVSADQMPGAGQIAERMKDVLGMLGEDVSREGLVRTPDRYEKAMRFLTSGYHQQLAEVVNGALFDVACDEMVVVKNIEFYSMCEHHMLPFFGKIHIAYLPKDKVIGLSKLPRIVDMFARRLQVQERLTQQIAEAVSHVVSPRGVGVLCEAQHFCMMMRGVKQHSDTITSTMLGGFRRQKATRDEFLALVRQ